MKLDETKLMPLFQRQEMLSPDQDEYIRNREVIMREVLRQLHRELKNYPNFWRKDVNDSDAQSMIFEALLKAIDTYKPSKGKCKFSSFLWLVISQRFKNYLTLSKVQKRDPKGEVISLESVLFDSDADHNLLQEEVIDADMEDNTESKLLYSRMIQESKGEQGKILELLLQGHDLPFISKALKMSKPVLMRQIQRIRLKYEKHI